MNRLPTTQKVSAINSAHAFRKIINRECSRADRYRSKLSLIIYEIGAKNETDITVRLFIRVMGRRSRSMDDIGWFDLSQIGVLLPHTPTTGAFKLSEDIASLLTSHPTELPFTIYTYPSQRWPIKQRVPLLLGLRLLLQSIFRPHNITSEDEFRAIITIELDRATRYGYIFSLLIFPLNTISSRTNPALKIATHLNSRLRETDEIGWLGSDKIAAILPYATGKDCQEIADIVCQKASIRVDSENTYTIYTYPTNWPSEAPLSPSAPPLTHENQDNKYKCSSPPLIREPHDRGNHTTSTNVTGQNDRRSQNAPPALLPEEIKHLFSKPLPFWKRSFDIIASSLGLFICSPIFLFAALGIKATSPGSLFFKQTRVGYMQRQFPLIKFRTMHSNANQELHRKLMQRLISEEGDKGNTKLATDKRIFPFGRFLRKSSIDELPQLINILKGEMSLIGPRPCLPYEADEYLRWHNRRFLTVPGLTGLWQVSGKNKLSFKQMIRLDISYEKNLSIWLDIKILLKTIPTVISIFFNSSE